MSLLNTCKSLSLCRPYLTNHVTVRWRRPARKPFWLGMAKSKLFNIPKPKTLPEEEQREMNKLYMIYERQMASLNAFMMSHSKKIDKESEHVINIDMDLHEKWNAETAKLREERQRRAEEEQNESWKKKLEEYKQMDKLRQAKVEDIIKAEIEDSKTYVTEQNIDEVIEKCLTDVKDFNYAVDLNGNIYKGTSLVPDSRLEPVSNVNSN